MRWGIIITITRIINVPNIRLKHCNFIKEWNFQQFGNFKQKAILTNAISSSLIGNDNVLSKFWRKHDQVA